MHIVAGKCTVNGTGCLPVTVRRPQLCARRTLPPCHPPPNSTSRPTNFRALNTSGRCNHGVLLSLVLTSARSIHVGAPVRTSFPWKAD